MNYSMKKEKRRTVIREIHLDVKNNFKISNDEIMFSLEEKLRVFRCCHFVK